jgi:hypothetical protein
MIPFEKSFASHSKANCWSNQNTINPEDVKKFSNKKFWFNCDQCRHSFLKTLDHITSKNSWCPYCAGRKLCDASDCKKCGDKSFASHAIGHQKTKNHQEMYLNTDIRRDGLIVTYAITLFYQSYITCHVVIHGVLTVQIQNCVITPIVQNVSKEVLHPTRKQKDGVQLIYKVHDKLLRIVI